MATGTDNRPVIVTPDPPSQSDHKPWGHESPGIMSKDDFEFLLTEVVRWRHRTHAAETALADLKAIVQDRNDFQTPGSEWARSDFEIGR